MPEAVQTVSLAGQHIDSVEEADLAYFVNLASLDLEDNKVGGGAGGAGSQGP